MASGWQDKVLQAGAGPLVQDSTMMEQLRAIFPDAVDGPPPPVPGAYLLAITLSVPLDGALRGQPYRLEPHTYLYAGSANGPGGIAARVARHLRKDKKPHWHVYALTLASENITTLAFPGGSECTLVARLLEAGYEVPLPGFGSSDCRTCPAHLLRLNRAGDSPRAAG